MPPHSLPPEALTMAVPTLSFGTSSFLRKYPALLGVLVVVFVLGGGPSVGLAQGAAPGRPFPQHVQYAPGSILPDHRSQAQQDDDVRSLYASWKSRYLSQAGTTGVSGSSRGITRAASTRD